MRWVAVPSAMATVLAALLMLAPGLVGCSRTSQGTYTFVEGATYTGEYKDGERHGQSTLKSAYGDTYTGEWKDGLDNGQGTYTYADGTVR